MLTTLKIKIDFRGHFEIGNGDMAMSSCTSTKPPTTKIIAASSPVAETSPHSPSLANQIASCALDHYHTQLTKKAKPKPGEEWTVFAAIVAFHRVDNRMWVVSSATGTKCTAQRHHELILHDSHAEVLARRGFIRILFSEIMKKNSGNTIETKNDDGEKIILRSHNLLTESIDCGDDEGFDNAKPESTPKGKQYQLDPNIGIHFYISDSPCGDASIYRIPSTYETSNNNGILYTGAKVIISEATKVDAMDCGGEHQLLPTKINSTSKKGNEDNTSNIFETPTAGPVLAREEIQGLGKLRSKSGRSNLPAHMRSHSHSCSDKIVLWSVLGLQGSILTKFLNPPVIPLTSVVVSIDSRLLIKDDIITHNEGNQQQQQIALERAISDRVRNVWEFLEREQRDKLPSWKPAIPTVHIVRKVYESGKAAMIVTSKAKYFSGEKRKLLDCNEEDKCSGENRELGDCGKNNTAMKARKVPPCGMAFNWNQNEGIEVLVGARGIKHGKKPKTPQDIKKLASRLCREKLIQDFLSLGEGKLYCTNTNTEEEKSLCCAIPETSQNNVSRCLPFLNGKSYRQIKKDSASSDWSNLKNRILTQNGSPLAGWLRSIETDDNFPVDGTL